jgi:hypothetical protein
MELNITQSNEAPPAVTRNRTREPNPFDGMFPVEEGKTLVVELPSETIDEKKAINKAAAFAQQAANEAKSETAPKGYTARVVRTPIKKGKKDYTRLTIWSIDRITRPGAGRKPAEATA